LTATQLAGLTTTQLAALSAKAVAALTADQIANLSTTELAAFTAAQISGLSSADLGVLSTAQIATLVQDGRKQRNYLDAIFRTVYANNPQKLAAWISASHVEHGRSHPAVTPTPAPTTTGTK